MKSLLNLESQALRKKSDRGGQTEEDRRGGIAYSSSWKGGFQPLLLFGGISTLLAIKGGFLPN